MEFESRMAWENGFILFLPHRVCKNKCGKSNVSGHGSKKPIRFLFEGPFLSVVLWDMLVRLICTEEDTAMSDRKALLQAILHAPTDRAPFGIYADWLDENGEHDLAHAYRWMMARGHRPAVRNGPRVRKPFAWLVQTHSDPRFEFSSTYTPPDFGPAEFIESSKLPILVFHSIAQNRQYQIHFYFREFEEAVMALARGLKNLRELSELPQTNVPGAHFQSTTPTTRRK